MQEDRSNGWEAVARRFERERSDIGAKTVRKWAGTLRHGASVLDLGCGSGRPISEALVGAGCDVFGVDASPTLVAAFRSRFPLAHVACEAVEESTFFGRPYDGVVAVGLLFLLEPSVQRTVIQKVSAALGPDGRFLFSTPLQKCTWKDLLTGRDSVSLGVDEYKRTLADAGLRVMAEYVDEGGNHYYDAAKQTVSV